MLPLSQQPYLFSPEPIADIQHKLAADIERLYGRATDLRHFSLTHIWRLARDLVLSIERWSAPLTSMPGASKMDMAVDIAWQFVDQRGGVNALRDRIADSIPFLPKFLGKWLLGRLLTKGTARRLIQFVLELAVREMKKLRGGSAAEQES